MSKIIPVDFDGNYAKDINEMRKLNQIISVDFITKTREVIFSLILNNEDGGDDHFINMTIPLSELLSSIGQAMNETGE